MRETIIDIVPETKIFKDILLFRCDLPNGDEVWICPLKNPKSPVGLSLAVAYVQPEKRKQRAPSKNKRR